MSRFKTLLIKYFLSSVNYNFLSNPPSPSSSGCLTSWMKENPQRLHILFTLHVLTDVQSMIMDAVIFNVCTLTQGFMGKIWLPVFIWLKFLRTWPLNGLYQTPLCSDLRERMKGSDFNHIAYLCYFISRWWHHSNNIINENCRRGGQQAKQCIFLWIQRDENYFERKF